MKFDDDNMDSVEPSLAPDGGGGGDTAGKLEGLSAALEQLQQALDRVKEMAGHDANEEETEKVDDATAESADHSSTDEEVKTSVSDDQELKKASAAAALSKLMG